MSRISSSITIVCYDISSNKLRRKIDRCMKDFGVRLQFSIFLCRLDTVGIERCRSKIEKLLKQFDKEKEASDSVIIFERINPDVARCLLGSRIDRQPPDFTIY